MTDDYDIKTFTKCTITENNIDIMIPTKFFSKPYG